MPTLTEIIANETDYADDIKYEVATGVVVTLGDIRKDYRLKDADYRQKTSRIADERRRLEEQDAAHQSAYLEAEGKLAEWTKQLLAANPNLNKAEADEELESDPRYRKLTAKLEKLEAGFTERDKKITDLQTTIDTERRTRFVLGHQQTLMKLQKDDPDLASQDAIDDLVRFAQQRGVPNLEDAYYLKNRDRLRESERKRVIDEVTPKLLEKARKDLAQPVLPSTRLVKPSVDRARSMDQAAEQALADPEIMGSLMGVPLL